MTLRSSIVLKAIWTLTLSLFILGPCLVPNHAMGFDLAKIRQEQNTADFSAILQWFPQFKTVVALEFKHPLKLKDLIDLLNNGVWPSDSKLISALGKTQGIFYTRVHNFENLPKLSFVSDYVPLVSFRMRGIYRIHLKVIEEGFAGPLSFSVSTPRNGFGKTLVSIEDHVSPRAPFAIRHDHAGNRWLELEFAEMAEGKSAKFDFYFVYQVNVKELLQHAIGMHGSVVLSELPEGHEASIYLLPSDKIESFAPAIQEKAWELVGEENRPKMIYRRLAEFVKKNITYDSKKRRQYFGGMKVYRNMSEMYEEATETLSKGVGACPDTSVLETAILRAARIPSRTASRWGHIYTEIYLPNVGWVSTSVTPTGIPLIADPDNRNHCFVSWNRDLAVQTLLWEGAVEIDIGE